jgi:predicted HD phosphohydrolase
MPLSPSQIHHLYLHRGREAYASTGVSHLQHALQCAGLAQDAGESPPLVVAALLHDIGLLLHADGEPQAVADTEHPYLALPYLRGLLPDDVLEPIRLHVEAKRYLCLAEPGYLQRLSHDAQLRLARQGGAYSAPQADAFRRLPHVAEAIRLRRYDDLAREPGLPTAPLAHYLGMLEGLTPQPSGSLVA